MSNATVGLNMGQVGEARRRQEAAKKRGERYKVDPETRARRVAVLEAREAIHEQQQAEAKAEQEASPTALQAILSRGTVDELAELSRSISRFDGRRLQEFVDEAFRAKSRNGYRPDEPVPETAPAAEEQPVTETAAVVAEKPAEAPPAPKASTSRAKR